MSNHPTVSRGEIWVAHLGRGSGRTPGKTRPVLIIQATALLEANHPTTLVIPLTTKLIDGATMRVRVPASGKLREESDVIIDQLRAIDHRRLVRGPLARLPEALLAHVEHAVAEALQLRILQPE